MCVKDLIGPWNPSETIHGKVPALAVYPFIILFFALADKPHAIIRKKLIFNYFRLNLLTKHVYNY